MNGLIALLRALGLAWNLIVKFKNLITMSVKKGKKSNNTSKLEGLNIETLHEKEQQQIKGGSSEGIITTIHPG